MVDDISRLKFDLMENMSGDVATTPAATARRLANVKFAEQLEKASLAKSCVREAHLEITKSSIRQGVVNGRACSGYEIIFVASALAEPGKNHRSEMAVFVAPHNPGVELKSTRTT
ncbi:MAG: hypothetical protein M3552_12230 [Planctomycetota bacterium]|nr:hypothetical protein [Planctomycetota bacterium]